MRADINQLKNQINQILEALMILKSIVEATTRNEEIIQNS